LRRDALSVKLHPALERFAAEYGETSLTVASSEVILFGISVSTFRFLPLKMETLLIFS
jgi:hypothetical protein